MATQRIERALPPQPMSVPLARSWADAWLADTGHHDEARETTLLVLSELLTNAVRQSDVAVRVTLEWADGTTRVEVFDSNPRLPRLAELDDDAPGGRGLFLVETLSTDWGVREEREGKTVWATIAA
jgi:anti-sigma regulatory factor (Ser/Thr protein kinase)